MEVACPGRWVNVANTSLTHEQACAAAGLSPTAISGQICASGESRPSVGLNAGSINYRYGTWGSGADNRVGGVTTSTRDFSCSDCGGGINDSSNVITYCWKSGQKRDHDSTDMVVAYACE